MVCLMWVFTLASGQNCTIHARTSAATTTLSAGLALVDLKPFRLYICKLQNHLWLWVVGMLYCNMSLRCNVSCHQPWGEEVRVFQVNFYLPPSIQNNLCIWIGRSCRRFMYSRPHVLNSRKKVEWIDQELLQKPHS